jgi:hypothetical protein
VSIAKRCSRVPVFIFNDEKSETFILRCNPQASIDFSREGGVLTLRCVPDSIASDGLKRDPATILVFANFIQRTTFAECIQHPKAYSLA